LTHPIRARIVSIERSLRENDVETGGAQQLHAARYSGNVVDLQRRRNLYLIGREDGRRQGRNDANRQLAVVGFIVGVLFAALLLLLAQLPWGA
jgi:tetrahydromethanopterin S-methyltransferase subunit F